MRVLRKLCVGRRIGGELFGFLWHFQKDQQQSSTSSLTQVNQLWELSASIILEKPNWARQGSIAIYQWPVPFPWRRAPRGCSGRLSGIRGRPQPLGTDRRVSSRLVQKTYDKGMRDNHEPATFEPEYRRFQSQRWSLFWPRCEPIHSTWCKGED